MATIRKQKIERMIENYKEDIKFNEMMITKCMLDVQGEGEEITKVYAELIKEYEIKSVMLRQFIRHMEREFNI